MDRLESEMKISTIVLDPPWHFQGGGPKSVNHKYNTMKLPDINALVCDTLEKYVITDNAHCYIWVVNMHIDRGLSLMEKIGFEYKTNICWVKNSMGMGYYFRGQHELCLFGVKGKGSQVRTLHRGIPSIIKANKREHSQKPEEFYTMVEARSSGPYLELFSRHTRPGWQMWGNEIGKLD
jgi:N6-adenosine-specific RNA methylase IME4